MPIPALAGGAQEAGVDRRDPGGVGRTRRWPSKSSRRETLSVAIHRTGHGRLKSRGGNHERRKLSALAHSSRKYRPLSKAAGNSSDGPRTSVYRASIE